MAADKLEFKDVATLVNKNDIGVTVTRVSGPYGRPALIYHCPLNVDWDGSPWAYGLDRPGSDLQRNLHPHETGMGSAYGGPKADRAKGIFYWAGVYSATPDFARWNGFLIDDRQFLMDRFGKYPAVQEKAAPPQPGTPAQPGKPAKLGKPGREEAPAPGYYVSQCNAIADSTRNDWDQRKYMDAATVAYGALSDGLASLGVGLNDYGLVIWNATGASVGFFFGDRAGKGSQKVGECSGKVLTSLAAQGHDENVFTFLVFPGSGAGVPGRQAPQFIDSTVRFRIGSLAAAANSHDLAVRLALGPNGSKLAKMNDGQALALQQIKTAFLHWGWNADGPLVYPDVDE